MQENKVNQKSPNLNLQILNLNFEANILHDFKQISFLCRVQLGGFFQIQCILDGMTLYQHTQQYNPAY